MVEEGNQPFFCDLCDFSFASEDAKLEHTSEFHQAKAMNKPQIQCKSCHLKLDSLSEVKCHEEVCPCKCQSCGQICSSLQEVEAHAKNCLTSPTSLITDTSLALSEDNPDLSISDEAVEGASEVIIEESFSLELSDDNEGEDPLKAPTAEPSAKRFRHSYKCDQCDYSAKLVTSFQSHMIAEHDVQPGDVKLPCEFCPSKFASYKQISKHKSRAHFDLMGDFCHVFECDQCGFKTGDREYFQRHMYNNCESVASLKPTRHVFAWKCQFCSILFGDAQKLERHIDSCHEGKTQDKFHCVICSQVLLSFGAMEKHLATAHQEAYKCKMCDFYAPVRGDLLNHIREMHKTPPPKTAKGSCSLCNALLGSYQEQRVHDQQCHFKSKADVPIYKCNGCDFETGHEPTFGNHAQVCNSSSPLYFCGECDQMFVDLPSLTNHSETVHAKPNNSELPEKCTHCNWRPRTHSSGGMMMHLRRYHFSKSTKWKVYACTSCNFKGTELFYFKEHVAMCKGVNLVQCSFCDKQFNGLSFVPAHMRSCHPTEEFIEESEEVPQVSEESSKNDSIDEMLPVIVSSASEVIVKEEPMDSDKNEDCGLKIASVESQPKTRQMRLPQDEFLGDDMSDDVGEKTGPSQELQCKFCDSVFTNVRTEYTHNRRFHIDQFPQWQSFKCRKCDYITGCKMYFANHVKNCNGGESDSRKSKALQSSSGTATKVEEASSVPKEKKAFHCQFCPVEFNSRDSLRTHNQRFHIEHFPEWDLYECAQCDYKTGSHHYFELHINKCNGRKSTEERRKSLDLPKEDHHQEATLKAPNLEEQEQNFPCVFCPKVFFKSDSLSMHNKRFHIEEFPDWRSYKCKLCGYQTGCKLYLSKHTFSCLRSKRNRGKRRKTSAQAKSPNHQSEPSDDLAESSSRFPCKFCSKVFNRLNSRINHNRRLHADKFPNWTSFKCEKCGYLTASKSYFSSHLKVCVGSAESIKSLENIDFRKVKGLPQYSAGIKQEPEPPESDYEEEGNEKFSEEEASVKGEDDKFSEEPSEQSDAERFSEEPSDEGIQKFSEEEDDKPPHKIKAVKDKPVIVGDAKRFQCKYCEKAYDRKMSLHSHMVRFHVEKTKCANVFECKACGYKTGSLEYFVLHQGKCGDKEAEHIGTECKLCKINFSSEKVHRMHLVKCHYDQISSQQAPKAAKVHTCQKCPFKSSSLLQLKMHKKLKCSRKAKQSTVISRRKKRRNPGLKYKCDHCPSAYGSYNALDCHNRRHHVDKYPHMTVYACSKCDYKTGATDYFARHVDSCQAEEKVYEATLVSRSEVELDQKMDSPAIKVEDTSTSEEDSSAPFSVVIKREIVEEKVEPVKKKPSPKKKHISDGAQFKCKYCANPYTTSEFLETHILRSHYDMLSEDQVLTCILCKTYKTGCKVYFKSHQEKCARDFGGGQLSKSGPSSTSRSVDKVTQDGGMSSANADFVVDISDDEDVDAESCETKCSFCKATFASSLSLLRHKERTHYDEIPDMTIYKCKNCAFKTGSSQDIKCHLEECGEAEVDLTDAPTKAVKRRKSRLLFSHKKRRSSSSCWAKKTLKCEHCATSFTSQSNKRTHMKRFHYDLMDDVEVISCPNCDYKTGDPRYLRSHQETCQPDSSSVIVPKLFKK